MIDRYEAIARLQDCRDLTSWEADFVESVSNWHDPLSDRQAEALAKLVRRRLLEDCEPDDFR